MPPTFISSNMKPYSPSPFFYDEVTNEPYLPLPSPHGPRIRITPPRFDEASPISDSRHHDDLEPLVFHMNHSAVYMWLQGPPFPYTTEDGVTWLGQVNEECRGILSEMGEVWKSTSDLSPPSYVSACPVRSIRERQDDGSDVYIGDIGIGRSGFPEVPDEQERERRTRENAAYAKGDPRIIWTFGGKHSFNGMIRLPIHFTDGGCEHDRIDFLAPSHHGKGIMTAAVRTIIEDWAVPHMGARHFHIGAFSTNIASQKVFLKNGFSFVDEQVDVIDMKKRGKGDRHMSVRWFSRDIPIDLPKDQVTLSKGP